MLKLVLLITFMSSFALEAAECRGVLKELLKLYPSQDEATMMIRIQNAENKHQYLRSFIPYYYQRCYELRETLPVYSKLQKHVAQIAGDAHVENFGYMLNNKGVPVFTLNDFDDVIEAPLFLDVMRLSQSSGYMGEFEQARLLLAYESGLSGAGREFSPYIKKLGNKAQAGGVASKAEIIEGSHGPQFAVRKTPSFDTTITEKRSMESVLKKKFGNKSKLLDSYRTNKESGGSAFGKRYHALTEINGEKHFIEFKEVMESGVVKSWVKKPISDEQRILKARKTYLGDDFNEKLDIVKIGDKTFQMRFKAEGNKSIDLTKVKNSELSGVIEDEFFVLGQLHRKALGGTDASVQPYLNDFKTVSVDEWNQSVKIMKKEVKAAYKEHK